MLKKYALKMGVRPCPFCGKYPTIEGLADNPGMYAISCEGIESNRDKIGDLADIRNLILKYDTDGNVVVAADGTAPLLGVSIIEGGYNDISGVEAGKVNKGEDVDILIKDIGFVIASAEIKKGQEVTATTGGKAAVAAAGDYVIGVALNNVSAGGYSRLQLSKYQKAKA